MPPNISFNTLLTATTVQDETPPYNLRRIPLGGAAALSTDLPPTILFLILFTPALLLNVLFLHLDRTGPLHITTRRHLVPLLHTAYALSRVAAVAVRLAWAVHPRVLRLEMAAALLAPAGTVLALVANILVARRFTRDYARLSGGDSGPHSNSDSSDANDGRGGAGVARASRLAVFCAAVALVMLVSARADEYFTRDEAGLRECRIIGLVADTVLLAIALAPAVVVGVVTLGVPAEDKIARRRPRFRARASLTVFTSALLTLVEGFRCGVAFEGREVGEEAWFLHRAAYYCLGFLIELVVVYAFLAARLDPRFRVGPKVIPKEDGFEGGRTWLGKLRDRVNMEAEVFGQAGDGHREEDRALTHYFQGEVISCRWSMVQKLRSTTRNL